MTVSRVINNADNVRPSTRDKVNHAVKELGYRPNKAARSLASANPITIGLIYINPNNTFLSAMLRGLLDRAHHADTHIIIEECEQGPDTLRTIRELSEEGVEGFILGPPLCDSEDALEMLEKNRIPAVTIGSEHDFERISAIRVDDRRAAYDMTTKLISIGHRRIAFMIGNPGQSASWLRLQGFREAMQDAGLEIDETLVIQGRFAYRSGTEVAEKLLAMENKPTAIIASNDDMAAGAIAAAHHRNIEVPAELTIVGFDDTLLATAIEPEITTIRQPIAEMAHEAVELLERNIRSARSGGDYKGFRDMRSFDLVLRDSHAPPPKP
jgi:LacI family transcriptional regulator